MEVGMKNLTPGQLHYRLRRHEETKDIKYFRIHFGNISIDCHINQPFRIFHSGAWVNSQDIKIDVYDLRTGDRVAICGSRGTITKMETFSGIKEEEKNEAI